MEVGINMGRPKTPEELKKSEKIFVNLTLEQKEKLLKISKKEDDSLSKICVVALKKAGYI